MWIMYLCLLTVWKYVLQFFFFFLLLISSFCDPLNNIIIRFYSNERKERKFIVRNDTSSLYAKRAVMKSEGKKQSALYKHKSKEFCIVYSSNVI